MAIAISPFAEIDPQELENREPNLELILIDGSVYDHKGKTDFVDREVEQNILCRVQQGDAWAWAAVTVTVSWGPFAASDHLGCCSYADEADFCQPGGYFDGMVEEALAELNKTVLDTYQRLKERELAA